MKYSLDQTVWMIVDNKIHSAKISEVRIDSKGFHYYFWHLDFPKDKSIVYDNLFKIDEDKLFESKKSLIEFLSK